MDVLINLIMVIILQCTCISNHLVHLKYMQFCQLYFDKAGKKQQQTHTLVFSQMRSI